ncbi:MAG TPA: hypothetical protein VME47_04195 [Acetobacteraceae bacterium]|nr:hypothetical protein [Acetobacteraceae bacterium]
MDDDALIDRGAALENELTVIKAARAEWAPRLDVERPRLRKAAV